MAYKNAEDKIRYNKEYKQTEKYKRYSREYSKQYRKKYPEKRKTLLRIWRKNNPIKVAVLQKRRRARKLGAEGSHTSGEWETLKAQYNWTCPFCRRSEPKIKLTEDHIIPLSRGGSDNIENIQPLCRSCNARKFTKIIKY